MREHIVSLQRTLIVQKRRAHCLWQRTKYPADKCHYNALAQNLKRILANYRNESYTKDLKSLTTKYGSFLEGNETTSSLA
jgi:hypothetical protein